MPISNQYIAYIAIVLLVMVYVILVKTKKGSAFLEKMKPKSSGTPFLNSFANDFTELARTGRIDPVMGREEEVMRLAQILSRRGKNNAILIGSPGVGKTAIVEGLAQRIIKREVPEHLLNKRLLALDVTSLMSGTKYRGEFEERAKKLVREISATNRSVILFIDEVHAVVQSQGTEGALNFSDILKPALARGDLQMIGATTTDEYEKYIKSDPALERRFQPVEVREPTEAETVAILHGIKDKFRDYHKVEFTDAALEVATRLSNRLIKERKLPDKAIDAIDEAGAMVKVAHLHTAVPMILYQAAVAKHPQAAELWKKIQAIDKKTMTNSSQNLNAEREQLEAKLEALGVETVDSNDVEKVIRDWSKK